MIDIESSTNVGVSRNIESIISISSTNAKRTKQTRTNDFEFVVGGSGAKTEGALNNHATGGSSGASVVSGIADGDSTIDTKF